MLSLGIEALSIRALRNLRSVDLHPGARFNVIAGDNGHGKTNLLEAIYVLATSRSFRASRPGELVLHDETTASVRASVREGDTAREQSVGLESGRRVVRIDGKRPMSLAAYAVGTRGVVFHPGEMALSMGAGSERRRLLDRLALYLAPGSMREQESFTRAMRERQRALEVRGVRASDLDHWEELMVRHGVVWMAERRRAALELASYGAAAFARIAPSGFELEAAYAPGAPEEAEPFRRALIERRGADLRRGSATVGPHRDDLALHLNRRLARGEASQGQHRAIVLALKSGEIEVIGAARKVKPILLLDDVSSELDERRTEALFSFLGDQHGQVFLTTTRPELIRTTSVGRSEAGNGYSGRVDFEVTSGAVRSVLRPA